MGFSLGKKFIVVILFMALCFLIDSFFVYKGLVVNNVFFLNLFLVFILLSLLF